MKRNSRGQFTKIPLKERFWDKVIKEIDDGCWHWIGARNSDGYGVLDINGKSIRAHRLVFDILFNKKLGKYPLMTGRI